MKKFQIALVMAVACCAAAALAQNAAQKKVPSLMGAVKDDAGKPMSGVTVSVRNTEELMTTSVYTDARGVYVFPPLRAGKYRLWAQAVKFNTEKADVTLGGAKTTVEELSMKPLANYEMQLTGYEWFSSLPDDTQEHKRMKQVLYVACTGCHSLDIVLDNRFDEAGWNTVVRSMEVSSYNGGRGAMGLPAPQLGWEGQIMRWHRNDLAKYLAEVRGPNSPKLNLKVLDRPTGDAARAVATEWDMPLQLKQNEMPAYQGHDWMLGSSVGMNGAVGVHDVVLDSKGIAWITQSRESFESNRNVIRLDTATGDLKAIHLQTNAGGAIGVEQAGLDPKGNIWMHSGNVVVKLDTAAEKFSFFPIPTVLGGMANSTDSDSQGRIFINGRNGVDMFVESELGRKDVAYPGWYQFQQLTPGNGTTYGVSADRLDNPWWSESYSDVVATRNMKTGKVTEFPMHDPEYEARKALMTKADLTWYDSIGGQTWGANSAEPLPYGNMPRRLAADKNGNSVWVPNWAQSNLAEIDINTYKVTYHKLPIQVHPYKTIVDKNHNVYTDTSLVDGVFRYVPSSGQWTLFRNPSHGCGSRHVSFDDYKGDLWVPCDQSDKVIRYQFRSDADLRALEAAAVR
jgi:streptogramin lyase